MGHQARVSVVIPSYNHEKYILETLESVLSQTYHDYEVYIVDDASTDHSVDVIHQFIHDHPEISITFERHAYNQGGVLTLNHLIAMAKGELIALINSDDVWRPEKLEQQIKTLEEHPELAAVFTQAKIVNDEHRELTMQELAVWDVFYQKNRSRGAWLRRFFFEQNCLCHPSILIRRSVYEQLGLYDNRYHQIPDLQMWVRFLKRFEFTLIEKPLVYLRWHATNTSVINTANSTRGLNELFFLYRDFFDNLPDDLFVEGFRDLFRNPDAKDPLEIACEKAFVYFKVTSYIQTIYQNIGLERLYKLMGDPIMVEVLAEKYHFSSDEFFQLGGTNAYSGSLFSAIASQLESQPTQDAQPALETALLSPPTGQSANILTRVKISFIHYLARYPALFNLVRRIWTSIRPR